MRIGMFVAAVACVVALILPSTALASDQLMTSPTVLQHVGFESPADSLPLYSGDLGVETTVAAASWGPISAEHQTGSYGLWCAGSIPGDFPSYPSPTRGLAAFSATDTTNYYQSWIQYSYIDPSYGPFETTNPFSVSWVDASQLPTASTTWQYSDPAIPLTPVWMTRTVERLGINGLPKNAGYFRFSYHSAPGDTSTPGPEGATVDDVMSTAYEFGPAGSITATREVSPHSTVDIAWTAAWAPVGVTPYYAVWRHDIAANTWTEVSASRVATTSFTDTGVAVNKAYEYGIQAWDGPLGSANWGVLAISPQVAPAPATSMTAAFAGSQTATVAPYGGQLAVTGTLFDVDNHSVSGAAGSMVVQTSPDNSTWTTAGPSVATTVAEKTPGSYVSTVTVSGTTWIRMRFQGGNGYNASASTAVSATTRYANTSWSGIGVAPVGPKYNMSVTISGTLGSETGASLTGRSSLVGVQSSPDNSTWTTITASVIEQSPSVYAATPTAKLSGSTFYRLVYLGELNYNPSLSASTYVVPTANTAVLFSNVTVSSTTPPYGGAVTVGASLSSESGAVTGRTNVRIHTFLGAVDQGSVVAAEDSPGHYSATFAPITNQLSQNLQYELTYPGDANQYYNATPAYTDWVTARPATMSFYNVAASPSVVVSGSPSTISADLVAEQGWAIRSADASVTLLSSPDNATWTTFATSMVDSTTAGHYAAVVPSVTSHRYFRFIVSSLSPSKYVPVSGMATSTAAEVTATPNPATTMSGTFGDGTASPATILYGATKTLTGALRDSGGVPVSGLSAYVFAQVSANGSSGWTTATAPVATSAVESSTAPGNYQLTITPNSLGTAYYRLAFVGTSALTPSYSSPSLSLTTQQATTSWSAPFLSPAAVAYGGAASVVSTLTCQSGFVASRTAEVALQVSADGSAWTTSTAAVAELSAGVYSAALPTVVSPRYYRFRFVGEIGLTAATSSASGLLTVNPAGTTWSNVPTSTTFPYQGQAEIAGSLSATSPLVGQAGAVTLQTSANGSTGWASSAAQITEDSPAHYAATFSPSGTGAYYRLVFAGVSGVYAAANGSAVLVSSNALSTGWSGEHASVSPVAFGGSTTLSAQLLANGPVSGESSQMQLQSSPNGSSWSALGGSVSEPSSGTYSATLSSMGSPGTMYYRFHYLGSAGRFAAADSAAITVVVNKDAPRWQNGGHTSGGLWAGIGTYSLWGDLVDSAGSPLSGSVRVQTALASNPTSFSDAGAAVAGASGHYTGTISTPATDTIVKLVYLGDATHDVAEWQAPSLSVSLPVRHFDTGGASASTVGWQGTATLSGHLVLGNTPTTDLGGAVVHLEVSYNNGSSYSDLTVPVTNDGVATFSATTPAIGVRSWYRLYAAPTASNPALQTSWSLIMPAVYLPTPTTSPSKPTHNKTFTVNGQVSGIPFATRAVTLRFEHKETKVVKKKKTTVWVLRSGPVSVRVGASSGVVKYKLSTKLKLTGSWRLSASVNDAYGIPITTGYRAFTVK